jgi:hypothetical protein
MYLVSLHNGADHACSEIAVLAWRNEVCRHSVRDAGLKEDESRLKFEVDLDTDALLE